MKLHKKSGKGGWRERNWATEIGGKQSEEWGGGGTLRSMLRSARGSRRRRSTGVERRRWLHRGAGARGGAPAGG
jgi:hypothetical protein